MPAPAAAGVQGGVRGAGGCPGYVFSGWGARRARDALAPADPVAGHRSDDRGLAKPELAGTAARSGARARRLRVGPVMEI